MQNKVQDLLTKMSVGDKIRFCSGLDFWHLEGDENLGIPSVMVADGPHGLRKQPKSADHLGIHESIPSTCFPTGVGLASTWNRDLVKNVGAALGKESQSEDVAVLLGPGMNIKRSPLCGRNFEYYSEDPYVTGEIAKSFVNGVQSQGVGTSMKHFAVNNQEERRNTVDVTIDERTLREIYLPGFEIAVKEAQPWTIMSAYNKVNGTYASDHKYLLSDILRDEWGYEGFVVSDWGAVNDIVASVKNGLELEMPSSSGVGEGQLQKAFDAGELTEEELDIAVGRILRIILKSVEAKKSDFKYDKAAHHALSKQTATESMVLLKNEANMLPLNKTDKIGVIGEFAKNPRFQGGGSSHVNPTKIEKGYDEIVNIMEGNEQPLFAAGYNLEHDENGETLINEAVEVASQVDTVVLFVGLPDIYESEGYDREHMRLPESHTHLIEEVAKVNNNIVIVLSNGSPIEMPWIGEVKSVLEAYLGGQASGGAVADLLFGIANPSGKLAETFPIQMEDNPSYLNFPGELDKVNYNEGIFVGYRYYNTKKQATLFPFGHGLSYTEFEYSNLKIDKKSMKDTETAIVKVNVKNVGTVAGQEVVQLYVKDVDSIMNRPEKELKGFEKIHLEPGEEKTVTFELSKRAFAYYDVDLKDWHVQSGEFEIVMGSSAEKNTISDVLQVTSTVEKAREITRNTTLGDIKSDSELLPVFIENIPKLKISEIKEEEQSPETMKITQALLNNADLRSIVNHSEGRFTEENLTDLIEKLNQVKK